MRARRPVDGVLQLPGDGAVVLRRREQDGIGGLDRLAEMHGLDGRVVRVAVLVVRGNRLELRVELEMDVVRQKLLRRKEELRVVRIAAKAAGDAQDPHRYACSTS